MHTEPTWRKLTGDDLAAVAALASRCLAADGGLPLVTAESFLARRYAAPGGVARGATDAAGRLVAAGAVRPHERDGVRGAVVTGMVDPTVRGRGVGGRLLDWGLTEAATMAQIGVQRAKGSGTRSQAAGVPWPTVTVETDALTDGAARLFASRGLRRVFAEDVMRFDLAASPIPAVELAAGVTVEGWSEQRSGRFFAVYEAAFRDRPGFPGWSARQWIDWTSGDDEFRPQWSLLAIDPWAGEIGFITCADGWIVQVGVRPDQRGRGLGAALVAEALRRMRGAATPEVLLDVNVDNPAGKLYERLGFEVIGRRARFEPTG